MDGFWIAVVSAAGVIGASLIQWRSNVTTNRNSAHRESSELESRNKQQAREINERETIRSEDRAETEKRYEAERQSQWRAKRQELHEQALNVLNPLVAQANKATSDISILTRLKSKRGTTSPFTVNATKFKTSFNEHETDLQERETSLQLYGSQRSSETYASVNRKLIIFASSLSALHKAPYRNGEKEDDIFTLREDMLLRAEFTSLYSALQQYIEAARSDLSTD